MAHLDLNSHAHDLEPVFQASDGISGAVVVRDSTACSNASVPGHAGEHEVQNLATDVVEVDVSELGGCLC